MRRLALLAALGALHAGTASAASIFPTRQGETGILDVPDAESLPPGITLFGAELRWDHVQGVPDQIGPFPLSLVAGTSGKLDLGLAMRQGGRPGDPHPSPALFSFNLKLQIVSPYGTRLPVGLAAQIAADRVNERLAASARVVASSPMRNGLRLAGYLGVEGGPDVAFGPAAGLAATYGLGRNLEAALQGSWSGQGSALGAALRFSPGPRVGLTLGADWLPGDDGFRVSLGFAFAAAPLPKTGAAPLRPEKPPEEAPPEAKPKVPTFADDRPHFRLRIPQVGVPGEAGPRHLQYGRIEAPRLAGLPPGAERVRPPAAADLRERRLQERDSRLTERERRLLEAEAAIAAREATAVAMARELDRREQALREQGQRLDERERAVRLGPPDRTFQTQTAEIEKEEKRLAAAEQGFRAAAQAAREQETQARARQVEARRTAQEALAAAAQAPPARRADETTRALDVRERSLGAFEGSLAFYGDKVSSLEKGAQARGDRLDAQGRRLSLREDRVAGAEAKKAAAAAVARGRGAGEKPPFVAVVKPPSSVVKQAPGAERGGAAPAAVLHSGVAVEKAVAAATVVYFPAAGQSIRELDREAVEDIAKLAGRERCELLVWARAQNPGLMAEATRRAEEVKHLAVKAGNLDEKQVVTRITTRPSATGVDVVVSALREQAVAPPAPAEGPPPAKDALREGETGKRQLRDAVQQRQGDIEICLAAEVMRQRMQMAEATLRVTVDRQGRIADVRVASGPLSTSDANACLKQAAESWRFPPSDAEYTVELPITIVASGAKKP